MEVNTIALVLLAVAIAHGVHSVAEPFNIRNKVKRLDAHIKRKEAKEIPLNIDTRLKAYGIGFAFVGVTFLLAFFIVSLIGVETNTALWVSILIITIVEVINTINIDKYHIEIEKVTKAFKED